MRHIIFGSGDTRLGRAAGCARTVLSRIGRIGLPDRLLRNERGNVVIVFAVGLTFIVGCVGLGVDAASWYASKRGMQNAADLAAAGAVNSLAANFGAASATTAGYAKNEGKSAAALHGFADGVGGTSVSIQIKGVDAPLYASTSYTAAANYAAAEAVVTQPVSLGFAGLFMTSSPTVVARSVTVLDYKHGDCMVALNPTAGKALQVIGSAALTVDCSVAVNSNSNADAFYAQGNAYLHAYKISVDGKVKITGGSASITETSTGSTPAGNTNSTIPDPYSTFTIPTSCGCGGNFTGSSLSSGGAQSGGGVINGDLNLTSTLTLGSGIYVFNGNIAIGSGGKLITNGATIILNSTATTNYTFTMQSAQANAILVAPNSTSGISTAGFALMQSRLATVDTLQGNGNCQSNCNVFRGGPTTNVTGAIYIPKGNLSFQGNPTATQGCTQLIADTFQYQGNPLYVNSCAGVGVTINGPTTVSMVE